MQIEKKLERFSLRASFQTQGETLGLLGASGCGKSVTLKCIAGVLVPDKGYIELDGQVLFDSEKKINLPPQQRQVGYLFQNYALFPHMTVAQNIAAGVREKNREKRKALVEKQLQAMQLLLAGDKYPRQLSGGQQQRVALARILAGNPKMLLLDEPFSALDGYLKWQLELELMETLDLFSGPTILVSHNRDEVYRMCASVCVLDKGRSQKEMPVDALFSTPRTLAACLLSGCKNISRAEARGAFVFAKDWGVLLRCNAPLPPDFAFIGVRSQHFALAEGPGENTFLCRVQRQIKNLHSVALMLETPGGGEGMSRLRLVLDQERFNAICDFKQVWVTVSPADILLLSEEETSP